MLKGDSKLTKSVENYLSYYAAYHYGDFRVWRDPDRDLQECQEEEYQGLVNTFNRYVESSNLENVSVFGAPLYFDQNSSESEPSIILSNLDLIDPSSLGWREILEFRKDESSKEKLRQLRHFISDKYLGRSNDFVREDIERMISEYNEVTRFWNFPTRKSIYTIALSGGTSTFIYNALGAALFDSPITTAIVGASTIIGSTAIVLESRRREVEIARKRNPVAYLVEAQRLTSQ